MASRHPRITEGRELGTRKACGMPNGHDWQRVTTGLSGVPVFCDGARFLKRVSGTSPREEFLRAGVRAEGEVLRHLNRLGFPAPRLEQAAEDGLITRRLPGTSLRCDFRREHSALVMETLADWFAMLHQLEVPRGLPVRGIEAELAEARSRIHLGFVDTPRVATLPGRPTPLQLWEELRATSPPQSRDSLTHGDPWPCNLFFEGTVGQGIIDWARAGVGAAERDLAVLDRALSHHYGPHCTEMFWTRYGARPHHLLWFQRLSYLF